MFTAHVVSQESERQGPRYSEASCPRTCQFWAEGSHNDVQCTYKSPMDMSPLINTLVCRGIRTFHTATSGSKEHKRSVTRLDAAVR